MPPKAKAKTKHVKLSKFKRHIVNRIPREYERIVSDLQSTFRLWHDGYEEKEQQMPSADALDNLQHEETTLSQEIL